jgi:HPt (histidine-containing phosphotransfer) domain-containing protein
MTNSNESIDLSAAMREIWNLNKGRVEADLQIITNFVRALSELQQAREAAHRLAGGLGVFGMHEAEQSARSIESLLIKALNELGNEPADYALHLNKLEEEITSFGLER